VTTALVFPKMATKAPLSPLAYPHAADKPPFEDWDLGYHTLDLGRPETMSEVKLCGDRGYHPEEGEANFIGRPQLTSGSPDRQVSKDFLKITLVPTVMEEEVWSETQSTLELWDMVTE
jgi:hypothetical protein